MLFDSSTHKWTEGNDSLLEDFRSGNQLLWLDLANEDHLDESTLLQEVFGIHPMAIQDAQRDRHPPKYEEFEGYYFLLLKGLTPQVHDLEFDTIQIAIFVNERWIITRHQEASLSIDALWDAVRENPALLAGGPKALTARIGRFIVNRYLALLFEVESSLDELEQDLLSGDPNDVQLTTLATYKTRLRKISRTFTYHEQIFSELRANDRVTNAGKLAHEFNDTYEQMERVESLAMLYYDLASDLIESSISLASHRLNSIMKILTIITAIFIPLGFLAGLYGMNFENMPELHYERSYYILLGTMGLIAVSLLAIFRYKRWL
jgi:magnesium transporter